MVGEDWFINRPLRVSRVRYSGIIVLAGVCWDIVVLARPLGFSVSKLTRITTSTKQQGRKFGPFSSPFSDET